jgi:hypothetical protein
LAGLCSSGSGDRFDGFSLRSSGGAVGSPGLGLEEEDFGLRTHPPRTEPLGTFAERTGGRRVDGRGRERATAAS